MTQRKKTSGKTLRPKSASRLSIPTPGEILAEEFLKPFGLSQNALARALHVPPRRINEIILGQRAITADTDLRLTKYFGLTEGYFLGLQTDYDLRVKKREIAKELSAIAVRQAAE